MTYNEKRLTNSLERVHMEQLKNTTDLLGLEDKNIKILSVLKYQTHLVVQAKLDSPAPPCPHCQGKMIKYDFQKASKIPLLDCQGLPTVLHLKKRRFQCKNCLKVVVSQTSIVKKNCQISNMVRQKIAQLLLEKQSMTEIAHRLAVSTSTVIRKLREFKFETDWTKLPKVMSWDEYSFKKSKMSFIAQDFESKSILAILDGRTHAVIRNHFQRYQREVRELVEVITMDMYSPYYRLAKQLFPKAKIVFDRLHIVQHLSRAMNRVRIQIMNQFDRKSLEYRALKRFWNPRFFVSRLGLNQSTGLIYYTRIASSSVRNDSISPRFECT